MKRKVQSIFTIMMLLLSVLLPLKEVNAQGLVKFHLDLGIQLQNGAPVNQTQYSFDIIQRDANMMPFEGALSYKYDKNSPEHTEDIYLPEGNYTFRLYDGSDQPFVREDSKLSPKLTQVTDSENSQLWLDTPNKGSFNDWGNGTVVYDLNFAVKPGQGLVNPNTGEQEITLKVLLADEESMMTPVDESNGESSVVDPNGDSLVNVPFQVNDQDGSPVEGVTIEANEESEVTDSNGQASFKLLPGTIILKITNLPEGYEGLTEFDPVTIDQDVEVPIVLTVTSVEDHVDAATVSFHVVDNNGQPVKEVGIQLGGTELFTNELGDVTFATPKVGSETYEITSLPEGYTIDTTIGTVFLQELNTPVQALVVNKTVADGEVLNVYVTDEADLPVENIEVKIENLSVKTDANGLAKFDQVPEGQHDVTIANLPEGFVADEAVSSVFIYPGTENQLLLGVSITEELGANAVIQVLDENAQPIEGVGISLNNHEYFTNVNGEITIEGLPVGEYPYNVTNLPSEYEDIPSGTLSIQSTEQARHIIRAVKTLVNGGLVLTVQDQDNQPVKDASVNIDGMTYTTNDLGQIKQADLSEGNHNYYLEGLPEGYQGQESNVFSIVAGQDTEVTIQVLRPLIPGSLTIQVVDQNKTPVPGAILLIDNETVEITDENGNATFKNLSPGTHTYVISELSQNYQFDNKEQKVEIKEDSAETRVLVVNKTSVQRQLEITVLDQLGQPVNKVNLQVGNQKVTTDTQGKALIKQLEPGVYDYSVTGLPKDYLGQNAGQVSIPEEEDATLTIYVQKEIKPASAMIRVSDQNSTPVAGVVVRFGGLVATTDAVGEIYFPELEPGNYYYNFNELPVGYIATMEDTLAELKEGQEFVLDLKVEKEPEAGDILVTVKDKQQQPVGKVVIEVDGVTVETDSKGEAKFSKLLVGEYEVKVIRVPKDYELAQTSYKVTVQNRQTAGANVNISRKEVSTTTSTTTTQEPSTEAPTSQATTNQSTEKATTQTSTTKAKETTVNTQPVIVETSLSANEQKEVDQQAKEATRQFVDSQTGVEVWIHPQDAGNVVKLVVNKLDKAQIPSLNNLDADVYQMTLVDKNNQAVALTKVAEVKLPTRPVNAQLKVLRLDQNNLSSLTFALHNRRVTFRTQKLGQFAISYGALANNNVTQPTTAQNTTVNVTKSTSVEKKQDLPGTGESANKLLIVLASGLLLMGLFILVSGYFKKTKH